MGKMTKKTVSGRSIGLLLFLLGCTFITALNASDNPFYVGVKLRDSSVFTYIGKVILQGGMPYRDTFDHKGPLIYLINALGLAINERIGVWLIEFVTVFVILLAAYRLARLLECSERVSRIAVALTALASFYYFNGGPVGGDVYRSAGALHPETRGETADPVRSVVPGRRGCLNGPRSGLADPGRRF